MGHIATASLALCLAVLPTAAQDATPIVNGPIAQAIDDYLTRCSPFGFSGSVLAVKDGAVILSKGYGLADRTTGVACAPATIYDIGQVAQPLTACAVLVLEQQKKLKTKDTLDAFLPNVPADKKKIQLHHLLTHTSGLPRTIASTAARVATREELIQMALRAALRDPPGTEFSGSDVDYALLAAIVEMVTKRPFEEALRELVLQPAGMTSAFFRQDTGLDAARIARACARPDEPPLENSKVTHLPDENATEEHELASEGWYSWGLRGAGGILASVEDLWRFEQALRGDALLTRESKKKYFTPELAAFAYGWLVQKGKRPSIDSRGWTPSGFASRCARFTDGDAYVVLLANTQGTLDAVEQDVRTLLFGGSVTLPPVTTTRPSESLADFAGEYEAPDGARWRVLASGDALLLEARSPAALELLAGKLTGDQKLLAKLSARIVDGLPQADFAQLHELDRKMETTRFQGVESWWRELVGHHGTLRRATLLGLVPDASAMNHAVALLEFERGEEFLDLAWGEEDLFGLGTGPPHAARLRLVPDAERSFVAYDPVRRKRLAAARFGAAGELELELPGGTLTTKKR